MTQFKYSCVGQTILLCCITAIIYNVIDRHRHCH